MKRKKAGSTKHFDLIIFSAVISAFLVFVLFLGVLIWIFDSAFEPSPPSSADEKAFEEKYEAAKQKYDKYYQKIVSGQEVLDLIENWDETDFGLAVDSVKNGRVRVDNVDKNDPNAVFTYWNKESGWYIDPNAYYKASFLLYQNPRKESDKGISDLYFHLVEDPTLSEDN